MTERVDRGHHGVAMDVVLNITASLSDCLAPPASNNDAAEKCNFFSNGFRDVGLQNPIWGMAKPFHRSSNWLPLYA